MPPLTGLELRDERTVRFKGQDVLELRMQLHIGAVPPPGPHATWKPEPTPAPSLTDTAAAWQASQEATLREVIDVESLRDATVQYHLFLGHRRRHRAVQTRRRHRD